MGDNVVSSNLHAKYLMNNWNNIWSAVLMFLIFCFNIIVLIGKYYTTK